MTIPLFQLQLILVYLVNFKLAQARQVSLEYSFCATALEDAQLTLAQAIYVTSGSLAMVTHDAWKSAWKKIGEYGPGFTPPTYHHMRN